MSEMRTVIIIIIINNCIQRANPLALLSALREAPRYPPRANTTRGSGKVVTAYSVVPSTSRTYQSGESLAVLHGNSLGRPPQADTGSGHQEGAWTAAPGHRKVVRVDPQEMHARWSL